MKAVVQRVIKSSVEVDNRIVGSISKGFTVLLGVEKGDTAYRSGAISRQSGKIKGFL
jgi:D-Tyr-tRNAtyr deacylase